jgi:hypothetical protein
MSNAPGYAVFGNVGSKILMLAMGSGFGVAVNNRTGKKTYMKMIEAGGGCRNGHREIQGRIPGLPLLGPQRFQGGACRG